MTVVEYMLLQADSPYALSLDVNGYLATGWALYDKPIIEGSKFYQAVIRTAERALAS